MKLAAFIVVAFSAIICDAEKITVSFPAERQTLPFVKETYVTGAVAPGRTETLYVNGATVDVYRTGAFIHMVPVTPGTNELLVCRGGARLLRKFVVAEESHKTPKPLPVVDSDDSPAIGTPGAWMATGQIFSNRVRSSMDASDSIYFLPKGFVFRAAEVKGTKWLVAWLENGRGFLPKSNAKFLGDGVAIPPKGLVVPDVADGFPDAPPYGKPPSAVTICIDAGHGGKDAGAISPHGWREKDLNLMQSRAIRDSLEKAGFTVIMTRDGDSFPELLARAKLAYDKHADAFISVHHNATAANRDPRIARHTTTYASTSNGLALATCIQKHIASVMEPVKNAGAQMKSYAVCRNPAVPSCLLEVDFINLPEGEESAWNPEHQQKIATAVTCGILDWMMK